MSEAPTRPETLPGDQPTEEALSDLTVVARGGVLNLVGVVSNTVFNFALVIVVTRGLGVTTTGMFFEAVALFNILATASQWGADVGVVRAIPRYRVQGRLEDFDMGSAPLWFRRSRPEPSWAERCSSSPGLWGVGSRAAWMPATSRPRSA